MNPRKPERLNTQADEPNLWLTGILLHWHVAVRTEAAVLADHPIVARNPIA